MMWLLGKLKTLGSTSLLKFALALDFYGSVFQYNLSKDRCIDMSLAFVKTMSQ